MKTALRRLFDGETRETTHLGQLLAEFVEFLLQRRSFRLRLSHFRSNLADFGAQAGAENDAASLARGDVGSLETSSIRWANIGQRKRFTEKRQFFLS